MLYSFDVFDTVITRKVAVPEGIFAVMQQKLVCDEIYGDISDFIRTNFFVLRKKAERNARKIYYSASCREITIDQIYMTLQHTGCLSDSQAKRLLQLEIETELDNVIGIPSNIAKVLKLKTTGNRVVFISDMYLSAETIREMLMAVDNRLGDIPLYVSSEYRKNKHGGELYSIVRDNENIGSSEWIHCGDNIISDVDIPKTFGIMTDKTDKKNLLPIEQEAIDRYGNDPQIQYMIGASVNARINAREDLKNSKAYVYGTTIISPIITGYISWVLSQSVSLDIKSLYFIARDGYLLKKTADAIIREKGFEIETYYIYGSRKAWRVASFKETNLDMEEFFRWSGNEEPTLKGVSKSIGISIELLLDILPKDYSADSIIVSIEDRDRLFRNLKNSELFKNYILEKASCERKTVSQYLSQSIDLKKRDYAFVDFIGSGYTQYCLSEILKEMTDYPTRSFFYRMDADYTGDNCVFNNYCPGIMEKKLIEPMMSAPHGTTLGYRKEKSGRIEPILNPTDDVFYTSGMDDFQRGVCDFLEFYSCSYTSDLSMEDFYIQYMTDAKDKELTDFIGDVPFANAGLEREPIGYAPRLSKDDIEAIFCIRLLEPLSLFYRGADFEYSLKRCDESEIERIEALKQESLKPEAQKKRITYWKKSRISWSKAGGCDWLNNLPGKRIAIYGAGKAGKMIEGIIEVEGKKEKVIWVDRNSIGLRTEGWEIQPVDELMHVIYDHLIIALANEKLAVDVGRDLVDKGIDKTKIISFSGRQIFE